MEPEDIANCQFVPLSVIDKAVNFIENEKVNQPHNTCKQDLRRLQRQYSTVRFKNRKENFSRHRYHLALHRAIYSHDWNKLLYLLKKAPIWEWQSQLLEELPVYVKALTILLMYHPSAQAQSLLMDYLHLVCTCRSDMEKKAAMKLILTLPNKFIRKIYPFQRTRPCYRDVLKDLDM